MLPDGVTGRIILLCWLAFAIVWIVGAVRSPRIRHGSAGWWNAVPVATGITLFVVTRMTPPINVALPLWQPTTLHAVAADTCAVAGLVILLWARRALGREWSAAVGLKEGHRLVTAGPYARVRHPIYGGALLLCLATALWLASVAAFVSLALVAFGLWSKARAEEQLLSKHFGPDYPAYRARTKMLIPAIW